jgi:hypothetical protein
LRQELCVTRTPRKWLANRELLKFRGVLAANVLAQACRSVGNLSNQLDSEVYRSFAAGNEHTIFPI